MIRLFTRSLALSSRFASTTTPKDKWDLCVGVLIERLPVVSKDLTKLESELMKTLTQIEFEGSLKSDHELRKEKDRKQQELIKSGKVDVELDQDAKSLQTAQDFEDMNQEELAKFKFTSRNTDDDIAKNLKNLNRKLDDTLMLVCEQNIEGKGVTALPQAQWNEGESLKQTAERIVKDSFGSDLKVHFYGHAPCGFYKYRYKTSGKTDSVGAKVFFYRAVYKTGEVQDKKVKFEWVNEEELKGKVRASYYQSVSQFLVS